MNTAMSLLLATRQFVTSRVLLITGVHSVWPELSLPQFILRLMIKVSLIALSLVPLSALAQTGSIRYTHTRPVLYSHYYAYQAYARERAGVEFIEPAPHATISRTMVFDTTASLTYPTNELHVEPLDRRVDEGEEHVDTTYVSFVDGTYMESRAIGEDIYLVSGQESAIPWRLEGEERVYLGLRAVRATAEVDSATVEAWFTPEIPVSAGPGLYGGLPGLILMVTHTGSGEVYAANDLKVGVLSRSIVPPVRGRKVSDEEYQRIKTAQINQDRSFWEGEMRLIEEGKAIIKRRGQ